MIVELTNHLWQSTLFALLAGLLAWVLRANRAAVRHAIWCCASVKFLIPFSLLIGLGARLEFDSQVAPVAAPAVSLAVERMARPFLVRELPLPTPAPAKANWLPLIGSTWVLGCAAIITARCREWARIRSAVLSSSTVESDVSVDVRFSSSLLEPGVVGLLRPVILLPAGIRERLTSAQLEAVLAHEMCHVRRRDNLTSAVHMIAETLFWFHPLVWWIGSRLVEERERACDEEVGEALGNPKIYAEAILSVCRLYVESPLTCVAGVTGADLKRRIEAIVASRAMPRLGYPKKLLLVTAGVSAALLPIAVGHLHAQSEEEKVAFEVASVRLHRVEAGSVRRAWTSNVQCPGIGQCGLAGNRFNELQASLADLLMDAYRVRRHQIAGLPEWGDSGHDVYDVAATLDTSGPAPTLDRARRMLQTLLADRFQLKIHQESRVVPVYVLTPGKHGAKLVPDHRAEGDEMKAFVRSWDRVAEILSFTLERPVIDKTGFSGTYVTRDGRDPFEALGQEKLVKGRRANMDLGPSVFSQVQTEWGLKLDAEKAPIQILVIDHVERPTSN